MPLTATEAAYLAGLIDGEGNIGVRTRKNTNGRIYLCPILQITNTNESMLLWVQEKVGGKIYLGREDRIGRKQVWSWQIWSRNAVNVIRQVYQHLIVKRQQADLIFTVVIKDRGYKLSEQERSNNVVIYDAMKKLNLRGTRNAA